MKNSAIVELYAKQYNTHPDNVKVEFLHSSHVDKVASYTFKVHVFTNDSSSAFEFTCSSKMTARFLV